MKNEYSAGGIVFRKIDHKIEILMIFDPYDKWAFPKGHIEEGESAREAALREVSEETGIDQKHLKIIKEIGKTNFWFTLNNNKIHKFLELYLIKSSSSVNIKPQLEEKIKKVKWINISRALDAFGYDNGKEVLKEAIKYLKIEYGI